MKSDEQIWKFANNIQDNYKFYPFDVQEPYPPSWNDLKNKLTPENLRNHADLLEKYNKDRKIFEKLTEENKNLNEKVVETFLNDALNFLDLQNHSKKDNIVTYCKKRIFKITRYTPEYLHSLFYEIVYLLQDGVI
jgi:hypothetical protein